VVLSFPPSSCWMFILKSWEDKSDVVQTKRVLGQGKLVLKSRRKRILSRLLLRKDEIVIWDLQDIELSNLWCSTSQDFELRVKIAYHQKFSETPHSWRSFEEWNVQFSWTETYWRTCGYQEGRHSSGLVVLISSNDCPQSGSNYDAK
jgi:hypothetical protein